MPIEKQRGCLNTSVASSPAQTRALQMTTLSRLHPSLHRTLRPMLGLADPADRCEKLRRSSQNVQKMRQMMVY